MKYKEDQGTNFGTWDDRISRLMYRDSVPLIVGQTSLWEMQGKDLLLGDYGGASGTDWGVDSVAVDIDESKNPDIVDDVVTHPGRYDAVLMRYLLHYLSDYQIRWMLETINTQKIIVCQFVNEGHSMVIKNSISKGAEAEKYFRTSEALFALFEGSRFRIEHKVCLEYDVGSDFYKNRLGIDTILNHKEKIWIFEATA